MTHISDLIPTAEAARPATLSELEDLLLDCHEKASQDKPWEVFNCVENFVFDHVQFKETT
jgi:hypothetical protein